MGLRKKCETLIIESIISSRARAIKNWKLSLKVVSPFIKVAKEKLNALHKDAVLMFAIKSQKKIIFSILTFFLVSGISYVNSEDIVRDAREGEDVTLECRFPPPSMDSLSYYWIRQSKTGHDNVAIRETPFDPNYK